MWDLIHTDRCPCQIASHGHDVHIATGLAEAIRFTFGRQRDHTVTGDGPVTKKQRTSNTPERRTAKGVEGDDEA